MSVHDNDRIDDLQSVVLQLGNALMLSERRTARLERTIRWGALSLILVLAFGLIAVFQPQPFAQAQPQAMPPSESPEEAIDRLAASLTGQRSTLGMMGMMMDHGPDAGGHGETHAATATDSNVETVVDEE